MAAPADSDRENGNQQAELCDTLLKECYWEVEGKVVCERHAIESGALSSPEREKSWASVDFNDFYGSSQESEDGHGRETGVLYSTPLGGSSPMTKAQKRTTRYMDLAKF